MHGQPARPPHYPRGRGLGHPGLPPQPHPRAALPIVLITVLGGEGRQHSRPRRGVLSLGPLQYPQRLRLHRGWHRRHIGGIQRIQRPLERDQRRADAHRLLRITHADHLLPESHMAFGNSFRAAIPGHNFED